MSSLLSVPAGVLAMLLSVGPPSGPPPNLRLDPALAPVVATMWQTSPTFRRQCARLAEAPWLVVAVWYDNDAVRGSDRATTTFGRHGSRLVTAQVRLADGHDPVELVAHELEHVVEQLDGVNLALEAEAMRRAVRRTRNGRFETERAIAAGLQAQREVREAKTTLAKADAPSDRSRRGTMTHAQESLPAWPRRR